jgi:hypothetical protein
MKDSHCFDFTSTCLCRKLDFYSTVKLINYIRHCYNLNQCFACSNDEQAVNFEDTEALIKHFNDNACYKNLPDASRAMWNDPQ